MEQSLAHIALVVKDYDEAIAFFTGKLSFALIEDVPLTENKRWVRVRPPGNSCCDLVLAKASSEEQAARVGDQAGGRVFLFLHTDDFWRDYKQMQDNGIEFVRLPAQELYGTVAVFKDLYGNLWDLVQPKKT